jgi:predicted nucleic-acid-binding protein
MNSLDANVVLRYLLADVPQQSQKARLAITTTYCYISDVILTEVIFVLEKLSGFSRPDIADLIRKLINLRTIVCSEAVVDRALSLYQARPQLSFPDCFAAVESLLSGDELLTFDRALLKHGGKHVCEP